MPEQEPTLNSIKADIVVIREQIRNIAAFLFPCWNEDPPAMSDRENRLVEAAKEAECVCVHPGHRDGCWYPKLSKALAEYDTPACGETHVQTNPTYDDKHGDTDADGRTA